MPVEPDGFVSSTSSFQMLGVPRPSRPPSIVLDFNAIEMDVNRLMSADLRTFRLQLPRMEVSCIVSELIKFQLKVDDVSSSPPPVVFFWDLSPPLPKCGKLTNSCVFSPPR